MAAPTSRPIPSPESTNIKTGSNVGQPLTLVLVGPLPDEPPKLGPLISFLRQHYNLEVWLWVEEAGLTARMFELLVYLAEQTRTAIQNIISLSQDLPSSVKGQMHLVHLTNPSFPCHIPDIKSGLVMTKGVNSTDFST
jgi:hypothetical protein